MRDDIVESAGRGTAAFIERGTAEFRRANIALFGAGFTTFALIYCVQPIMPVFSEEFGIGAATASLSLSLTTQSLALAMLVASSLSEVFGRKPVMLVSLFASSALTLTAAAAPDWSSLLLLRALAGLAFSGLPATAMAYVGEEMAPRSTGLAMGLYIGGTGLGALGGRFVVGLLTDVASWRVGLFAVGVMALATSLVFLVYLPASRHFKPRPLEARGLLRSFARHLEDRAQRLLYAMGFMLMGVYVALYNYLGYRLMAPPFGFGQTAVGAIFGISLVGIGSSAFVGDWASRLGRGRVFWLLVLLMLGGMLLTLAGSLVPILLGMALVTLAFYGAHAVASSWVGILARGAKAQAASLYLFAYYSGSSLIGWIGGLAWERAGWTGLVGFCAIVLCLAAVSARALPRPRPGATSPSDLP